MEMGYRRGTVTLVALADGTTSLYTRAGGGIIRALTYTGQTAGEATEDDLGQGRHPLSPVFHAGHRVITELRLIDEARQPDHR